MVDVALGARSYEIVIGRGTLPSLGTRMAALRPGAKAAMITDATVARHHLAAAAGALALGGIAATVVTVPAGESSKSFAMLEQVCEALIAARIERGDLVVALGGGVVGDLAGFAAAVVRRGLDYVQVPTTLLAQVDSSVGGKTAIDSTHGKNLVGAFHQPILVVADTALARYAAGARVRAPAMPRSPSTGCSAMPTSSPGWRATGARCSRAARRAKQAIATSCRAKAAIVARDERETGDRALLNLGHTFGHAFEAAAGFSGSLLHGEAISLGMVLAFEFSARRGLAAGRRGRAGRASPCGGRPADPSVHGRRPACRMPTD